MREGLSAPPFLSRLLLFYVLVGLWVFLLGAKLVQLQVFRSESYRQQAERQRFGFLEVRPRRGDILDRRLVELAKSIPAYSVSARPGQIESPLEVAQALAPILQQPVQELYRALTSQQRFLYLARRISTRRAQQLQALDLRGIALHKESRRVYPGRELAAHVLGFVGLDAEGLSGLEYLYEEQLQGKGGRIHLEVDARRQIVSRDSEGLTADGNILVLHLDASIQFIVEQVLRETVESSRAVSGSAILMNPQTGAILAMASYPSFDPNHYQDFPSQVRRNHAILDLFEPGSIFKIVTFAAVFSEGAADPSEMIDCRVGTLQLANKVYREAERSYGFLTPAQILAKSSNVGTIRLALRVGEETLYRYIRRFGFGQKTGIDLPGEQAGLLRPPSQWSAISIGAHAIGQEVGVTALQMVRALAAIANGGYLVRPRIVKQILSPSGDVLAEFPPERTPILSPQVLEPLRQSLALTVLEGTGKAALLEGYSSAGKTGTAQKFVDGAYSKTRYVSSYMGFAPLERPQLAGIVVIDEPRTHHYGGRIAAPAFKQIMERSLIHLKVPKDREALPRTPAAPSWELVSRPGVSESEGGFPAEELSSALASLREASPRHRSQVAVATEWTRVPDFSGMNLRQVARQCAALGLKLKISGSGVVVGQRPAPHARVSKGTVCEVFFARGAQDDGETHRTDLRHSLPLRTGGQ